MLLDEWLTGLIVGLAFLALVYYAAVLISKATRKVINKDDKDA